MSEDTRCCGTGTCLIDANGRCWCGQQWDGEKMCRPAQDNPPAAPEQPNLDQGAPDADTD
ncbi:hypothetical protein [Rhodoferax sp.]|uniref:hypothetical protein n=1 Tax=Rhodoferax sp. TaxID=50421 RepID=UPI001A0073F9|nr:hypothetical protein [Rhodoferax sp.]MBE0474631.1 hypothetical protein [Rhodoferax sp.]